MAADLETRSPLVRFLDSFLQERNIKWMLGIGVLLLFGSSLRLVLSHWEHYSPVWKSLILVGYTASVYFAGELCRRRLGLRTTGTVLLSLTVLLIPLTFHAFHHVRLGSGTAAAGMPVAVLLGMAGAAAVLASLAARRIFSHFLRGSQPTFLVAYLILCVAGAVLPEIPTALRPWSMLLLWGVFAVGAVKVNRHVFWLTEAHRLPRVFGFFPILLLGTQFLTLFALHGAREVPVAWMGVGCVLVALPVLLTADAVARVFEQRTGGLVRPWPWSVVLPFVTGLVLCAAGVCLAAVEMPRPMALVPAAALAAAMMGVAARRTKSPALVWAMLAGILVAYRYSPLYFREMAEMVLQTGARAVREEWLPLAFYGLTCLPLIAVLTTLARRLAVRGNALFATPMRQFAIGLSSVLLLTSFGHPKAIFPVGVVMTGTFAVQAVLFRRRPLVMLAIGAAVTAAVGFTPFVEQVLGAALPGSAPFYAVACVAAGLLAVGPGVDRWCAGWQAASDEVQPDDTWPICQWLGLMLTAALALGWVEWLLVFPETSPWGVGGAVTLLCLGHAYRTAWPGTGELALVFPLVVAAIGGAHEGVALPVMAGGLAVVAAVYWMIAAGMERRPGLRVSAAFGPAARHVGLAGMTLLLALHVLPGLVLLSIPQSHAVDWARGWFSPVAAGLVMVWCFDAVRRTRQAGYALAGCAAVLGTMSAGLNVGIGSERIWEWYLAAWGVAALAALPVATSLRRRVDRLSSADTEDVSTHDRLEGLRAIEFPVWHLTLGVLVCVAVGSLVLFAVPFRVAGAVGLLGMMGFVASRQAPELRPALVPLANWQLLCGVVPWLASGVMSPLNLDPAAHQPVLLAVAALAGISLIVFELTVRRSEAAAGAAKRDAEEVSLSDVHCVLLRIVAGFGLLLSTYPAGSAGPVTLAAPLVVLAAIAFGCLAAGELIAACRTRNDVRVWLAELVVALAVGYFALFGVIHFGRGIAMFVVLATGLLVWMLGAWAGRHERLAVLAGPFRDTGMVLPLVAVAIGVYRHFAVAEPAWLGANSLALLLAAAFYFWRGLERREAPKLLASAVIVNLALTLLWRELRWSDPQFFLIPLGASVLMLVELLKREIHAKLHDPLRYAGALLILVSPTFHIVGGSWAHLISLMVISVAVALLAIGLRVRALLYAGTAFLAADLVAILVRGSFDHPNLLWIAGIGLGSAVIALAAACENHRERLLGRLRVLAAELESWR